MALVATSEGENFVEEILEDLAGKGHNSPYIASFTRKFLANRHKRDFDDHPIAELADMIIGAQQFFRTKESTAPKIEVSNATASGEPCTIVRILNRDMPFIVDSVLGEIQEWNYSIKLALHPLFFVERDDRGQLTKLFEKKSNVEFAEQPGHIESFVQIHLDPLSDEQRASLQAGLIKVMEQVALAVRDWKKMISRVRKVMDAYTDSPPPVSVSEIAEAIQFLEWIKDDNFTFLGIREYELTGDQENADLKQIEGSGLGILSDPGVQVLRRGSEMVDFTPEVRKFFFAPAPLIVTKANVKSLIHRRVHMDYIGIKTYSPEGKLTGEFRIVGLFTSGAYTKSAQRIPLLRHKVDLVLKRHGQPANSHAGKALMNILETFPRDELFQIDVHELYQTVLGILALELKPEVKAFIRFDEFDRFVSVLVFVPRDRYRTDVRAAIGDYLATAYDGRLSAYYPYFPEGNLVRIHFIIGRYGGETPRPSQEQIEADISRISLTWNDDLEDAISVAFPGEQMPKIRSKYLNAFSPGYQDEFSSQRAVEDIATIEQLSPANPFAVNFYKDGIDENQRPHIAIYNRDGPIPLSKRVPIIEDLGFEVVIERSFVIEVQEADRKINVHFHDMALNLLDGDDIDFDEHGSRLAETFGAVWRGDAADDSFNRLVLQAGINWREASVLRAYGAYLRQIRSPFGQNYLSSTLLAHSDTTGKLIELFRLRSDPNLPLSAAAREPKQQQLIAEIDETLATIPSLDEDRIIRHYLNLILSTWRTNFYQTDENNQALPALAFKIDSAHVDELPEPRPFAEIFVYSPRVEGIHLRGGRIARGGLRWSDRAQDFRTEILGLAKAQQVKNTVIVPTGSKGGFVPKMMPRNATREETLAEGVACYRIFISSLLSVTDNLSGQEIIPPAKTISHDGDDSYLVVAADKGTATFSDYANEISESHNFWLGDAFASGGSAGYDHKKMGITARGGWEAVKRHFSEMNIDIQTQPVRVIGIGDMSGDVFGNGMLLSKCLKIVAAFDHRDIFIDPDPDPETSWNERQRLFQLPRSSWNDYDSSLISEGGGVFSRQLKSVPLSAQMKELTKLTQDAVTPNELIRAILKAEADLLWFGGIGTYIRASSETNDDAGDRANDAIRIEAPELNLSVIGEGANLGMTQLARIEFARNGGRVNSDAVDNSAGVNSSDLEVNIKIAAGSIVSAGKLDISQRNELLVEMTDEVAEKCLRNNYLQTLAISLGEKRGNSELGYQQRLIRELESISLLDREIEYLPSDSEIAEKMQGGQSLTRPELAVLLAYAKIDLYDQLIASTVPDDPFLSKELMAYFPETLQNRYGEFIESHRLRREIIATRLANAIVNRGGSTIIVRLKDETGRDVSEIAKAFTSVMAIFSLDQLYRQIDQLDNQISGDLQLDLYLEVQQLLRRAIIWFLKYADTSAGTSENIDFYQSGISTYTEKLPEILTDFQQQKSNQIYERFVNGGVSEEFSEKLAYLEYLVNGLQVTLEAQLASKSVVEVASMFRDISTLLRLDEIREKAGGLTRGDHFDSIAINSALSSLDNAHRQIVRQAVEASNQPGEHEKIWIEQNTENLRRTRRSIDDILDGGGLSLSKLTVAVAQISELSNR